MSALQVQQASLFELEAIIERGVQTFVEVGLALMEVRDRRLYREAGYATFEKYCVGRWGWKSSRSRQLIGAAYTAQVLSSGDESVTVVTPQNEAQARELTPLAKSDPQAAREVWSEVVEESESNVTPITAARIREKVEQRTNKLAVHFSSESPEWYTPVHIIEAATKALGDIDLDPCSNSHETPTVPAGSHFTREDDGLSRAWFGRVYMNPPYGSEIKLWAEKLADEYDRGNVKAAVALVPARTDTAWFRRIPAWMVCFISGRLTFSEHENAAPFPSAVMYLGDDSQAFVEAFSGLGLIYQLVEG